MRPSTAPTLRSIYTQRLTAGRTALHHTNNKHESSLRSGSMLESGSNIASNIQYSMFNKVCCSRVCNWSQSCLHMEQELLMCQDKGSHVPPKNRLVWGCPCNTIPWLTKIQHSNAPSNALWDLSALLRCSTLCTDTYCKSVQREPEGYMRRGVRGTHMVVITTYMTPHWNG